MKKNRVVYKNILHYVHVDTKGIIIATDNTLFTLAIGTAITEFHPIFLTAIPHLLENSSETMVYPGLFIEHEHQKFYCDVSVKKEHSFIAIVFFNYSHSYERKQRETQFKNETSLLKRTKKNTR